MRTQSALISLTITLAIAGCQEAPPPDDSAPVAPGADKPLTTTTIGRAGVPDPVYPIPPGAKVFDNPNRVELGTPTGGLQSAAATVRTSLGALTDGSGKVQMRMWKCHNDVPEAHPIVRCRVDPDWVLVGGGAWAQGHNATAGALLTASYPINPSAPSTWEGQSKDHRISDPHTLHVYAIGLMLENVGRNTLQANIRVDTRTVGPGGHLNTGVPDFSSDFVDLGSGAFVEYTGAGNMLTTVFPWSTSSKEHMEPDAARLTAYRMGIRKVIPGFAGELEGKIIVQNSGSLPRAGDVQANAVIDPGYVPVGIGGTTSFNGFGRLLYRMGPFDGSNLLFFSAASKDHEVSDTGVTWVQVSLLRKKP